MKNKVLQARRESAPTLTRRLFSKRAPGLRTDNAAHQ
ncbi:hypothetical protein DSM3645_25809 [Blastopirellula marina DSM 3645]|uniref:Uncharacterized protein n=1 Tax=Blastopirellula marina DSM 3645 TaxID=314230 RepID=A4A2X4_9BACT|nr:hypothetical protein DSM3645_25809 [Blastopirellula marina DSM 3645]